MNVTPVGTLVCCGIFAGLLSLFTAALAQRPVIPIWPGVAPGSEHWTQHEVDFVNPQKEALVRNVVRPTLTAFLPDRAAVNGTAVIVCPGGGFRFLSWQTEGTDVAEWLAARGVAAFVLKYRLVNTGATEGEFQKQMAVLFQEIGRLTTDKNADIRRGGDPDTASATAFAAADGRQAVKLVRRRAAEWGIATDRIGILGFSAGAVVAVEAVLRHDADSRPNFAAPIYFPPLGEVAVPDDAPPLFILCAQDDPISATASPRLYSAWTSASKPAELHIYAKGGHGFGMKKRGMPIDHWIDRFGEWLASQGLLKPTH